MSVSSRVKWWAQDSARYARYLLHRAKHRFCGGYKCTECSKRIPLFYTELSGQVNGTRLAMSVDGPLRCKSCLLLALNQYFDYAPVNDDKFAGLQHTKCDVMHDEDILCSYGIMLYKNPTAQSLGLNIRFCVSWWNGFAVSQEAIIKLLQSDETEYKTSTIKIKFDGHCYVDKYGVEYKIEPR